MSTDGAASRLQRELSGELDDATFSSHGSVPPPLGASDERALAMINGTAQTLLQLSPSTFQVYHLQDEQGRNGSERPFPFRATTDPLDFAVQVIAAMRQQRATAASSPLPACILFQVTPLLSREKFDQLLDVLASDPGTVAALVLVGLPHWHCQSVGYSQPEAAALARARFPSLPLGGLLLPERHIAKRDEHERMLAKQQSGLTFFITQVVYAPQLLVDVLTAYADLLDAAQPPGIRPPRLLLTFSPLSCAKTLDFLAWLGVCVPDATAKRILDAPSPAEESVRVCCESFEAVLTAVRQLKRRIPIAFSTEVVTGYAAERNVIPALHSALLSVAAKFHDQLAS